MDFTNASAIVTGGAGGFGPATVRSPDERATLVGLQRHVLGARAPRAQT